MVGRAWSAHDLGYMGDFDNGKPTSIFRSSFLFCEHQASASWTLPRLRLPRMRFMETRVSTSTRSCRFRASAKDAALSVQPFRSMKSIISRSSLARLHASYLTSSNDFIA